MKVECYNCHYCEYVRNELGGHYKSSYICHRYPPQLDKTGNSVFVKVSPYNWCGEFLEKRSTK